MSAGGCRSGTPARSSRSALGDPEADPGSRCDAAPHAPPRTFLRVPRLLTRRLAPALTKGHASHVSPGRLERSELLPHPSGAVTPDVALRSALSSPPLHPAAAGGEEGGATLRSCAPAVHAWHGWSDPWIHLSTQDKVHSIQKIEGKKIKK